MGTESYFNDINEKIIEEINNAEISLFVVVAWITDKRILNALIKKQNQGIDLSILVNKDDFNEKMKTDSLILKLGKNIKKTEHHHKFCIIDYCTLITGSYNWTNAASLKRDQENIIVSKDSSILIKDYLKIFYKLIAGSSVNHQGSNYRSFNKIGLINLIELPELQVDGVGKRYYTVGEYTFFMDARINVLEINQEVLLAQYLLKDGTSRLIISLADLPPYDRLPEFYCSIFVSKKYSILKISDLKNL